MASQQNDLKFGLEQEDIILPILEKYFIDKIQHTKDKYCKYDFKGEKFNYELKSRKIKHNQYNTALLGYNKKPNDKKPQYFIFNYTDGIYYIKYDEKVFNTFDVKEFQRNRRIDYNDVLKPTYFIPYEKLTKIEVN